MARQSCIDIGTESIRDCEVADLNFGNIVEEITEEDLGISFSYQTAFQVWWIDRQSCIDTENIWDCEEEEEDANVDFLEDRGYHMYPHANSGNETNYDDLGKAFIRNVY